MALLAAFGDALAADAKPDADAINLLSWGTGALLIQAPASYSEGAGEWSALAIQDERVGSGWATPAEDLAPKVFVFELAEKSEIVSLVFDTAQAESAERGAKNVRVEISDRKDAGYAAIADLTLAQTSDGQKFPLKSPATGRYIKLTVLSNWGDPKYIEIMGFAALGKQLTHTALTDNTGSFDANERAPGDSGYRFRLAQSGATAAGCYEHDFGLIENGGFDGHVLKFTWRQGGPDAYHGGPALLIFAADGQSFTGFWWNNDASDTPGLWFGKRVSKDIGACPHWKPGGNAVEQQLKAEGRARIYGILFDTDSDHLKDESKAALDQLLAAAKSQTGWKFLIEGHTDSTGGDARNQPLSERRAAAVKAYLVNAGVDAARLSTQGFGASKPVASNDIATGRAQNRRVEVVKQ